MRCSPEVRIERSGSGQAAVYNYSATDCSLMCQDP